MFIPLYNIFFGKTLLMIIKKPWIFFTPCLSICWCQKIKILYHKYQVLKVSDMQVLLYWQFLELTNIHSTEQSLYTMYIWSTFTSLHFWLKFHCFSCLHDVCMYIDLQFTCTLYLNVGIIGWINTLGYNILYTVM